MGASADTHLMQGLPPNESADTLAWIESGCPARELPCRYIVSKPAQNLTGVMPELLLSVPGTDPPATLSIYIFLNILSVVHIAVRGASGRSSTCAFPLLHPPKQRESLKQFVIVWSRGSITTRGARVPVSMLRCQHARGSRCKPCRVGRRRQRAGGAGGV